jgi:hypothetical protein
MTEADHTTLLTTLELAVPLRIDELCRMPSRRRDEVRMQWARDAAQAIAHEGDVLQYGSKRKGKAASVFNHLAKGLAAGAFQPGGIDFAGHHWEVTCDDLLTDDPPPRPVRPVIDAMRSL